MKSLPASSVIPMAYQFNMLCDSSRISGFSAAISEVVKPGDVVIDLGCGVGLLSILAAKKGARVIAVEIDDLVLEAARDFVDRHAPHNSVSLVAGDARKVAITAKADVVICEMLDTGLIAELQVAVMNRAVDDLLKPGGITIPASVACTATLAQVDFSILNGMTFPLPYFDRPEMQRTRLRLSNPVEYLRLVFTVQNQAKCATTVTIESLVDGVVNAVILETSSVLTSRIALTGSCWLNPPLILPIQPVSVSMGTTVSVCLEYMFGGGLGSLACTATST